MILFAIRNVASAIFTIWFAVTVAFFALRILPGDAISSHLIEAGATESEIAERRETLGLNASPLEQYVSYLSGLARGNLGDSLSTGLPVVFLIRQQLVPTVTLATLAMLIAVILGLLLGVGTVHQSTVFRKVCQLVINLSISTPIYWTGTIILVIFAVELRWFPVVGDRGVESLVLPVGLLSFHVSGAIARIVQVNIVEVRRATFVLVAHAKGLPSRLVLYRHTLRVALLPVISMIALQFGFLLSGTVITETLFSRPGLGSLLLSATRDQDYPLVQGMVVLSATIYIILNLAADTLQKLVDPRLSA